MQSHLLQVQPTLLCHHSSLVSEKSQLTLLLYQLRPPLTQPVSSPPKRVAGRTDFQVCSLTVVTEDPCDLRKLAKGCAKQLHLSPIRSQGTPCDWPLGTMGSLHMLMDTHMSAYIHVSLSVHHRPQHLQGTQCTATALQVASAHSRGWTLYTDQTSGPTLP